MHNGKEKKAWDVNTVANTAVLKEVIKCVKNLGQGHSMLVGVHLLCDECPYKVKSYSLLL